MPGIIIVSDAVEGTFADLDGKSRREEQKNKHCREWKRSKGADRTEMRKEEKRLRYALQNGSAWSKEKKHMRRYKGTFDIFFRKEAERQRKNGDLRRVQQESMRKRQEIRITSTR